MEYELSKYVRLIHQNEKYIVQYTTINKEIIINESIYNFLKKINDYGTIEKVFESYPFKTEIITNNLIELLNYFSNLGIIVIKGKEGIAIDYEAKFDDNFRIDNYTVISTISNRKSGELYKIADENYKEFVLKVIRLRKFPNLKAYKKALIFFEKENFYGASMDHPNLCKIKKGIYEKEWGSYYLMEYINGKPISGLEKINEMDTTYIFRQILDGFNYIHEKNMLHGDIHLNNILINNDLIIKIIDYGLTSNLSEEEHNNGGVCEFIAPERMSEDIIEKFICRNTVKAEIYQIGIIYYYILTGNLPFKSNTWKTIYQEKSNFNINNLENTNSISKKNLEIISKCLSPNPDFRYSSIREIINMF